KPRSSRLRGPPSTAGLLLVLVVICAAYFVPRGVSWNPDSHIFLTASIVDRGTLNIDPLAPYTGDVAFANGHFYSDKAPGLSLAAIPVYALLKWTLLGGHAYTSLFTVPTAERMDFLIRYLLAIVYAAVPTGLITALLFGFLARFGLSVPWRAGLALTYALGTFAGPFAAEFFSHQLAALLLFAAFLLLFRVRHGELRPRVAVGAGVLLGYAVITEYPTVLIAVALSVYVLAIPRRGWRLGGLLAAGAVAPLLLGGLYNTLAFGGPFSQGYTHLAGPEQFRTGQAQGFMGITAPHLDALWQTTFGPYRGIFLFSPVLLLALPGFVVLWRLRAWRAETLLLLATVGIYFLFGISYFAWDGGYSMGPRQFLPALPFLMLPVAALLRPGMDRRWRPLALALGAWSLVVVELSTAVGALFNPVYDSPLSEWVLPRLAGFSPGPGVPAPAPWPLVVALAQHTPLFLTAQLDNNWGMVIGLPGLAQLLPLALLSTALVFWHWRRACGYSRLAAARQQAMGGESGEAEAWERGAQARLGGSLGC
ncbi:MAG: hypothetical protein ACTHMJ_24265, partial [Thermomicrobiales bacterium]